MSDASTYLTLLGQSPVGGPTESAQHAGSNLDRAAVEAHVDLLRAQIAYLRHRTGLDPAPELVARTIAHAQDALRKLVETGESAVLSDADVSALEAVVIADGSRPSLFVVDDFVDVMEPAAGQHAIRLAARASAIRSVCRSVGRVDDPGSRLGYQGTAWVIEDGLVTTNFHVLKAISTGAARIGGRFTGRLKPHVAVHFGHELGRDQPERRFPIRRVVMVGAAEAIVATDAGSSTTDDLDIAVLELEAVPRRPFPLPLPVARGDDPHRPVGGWTGGGQPVDVVGYPGSGGTTAELFDLLFQGLGGYKRLAPGRITTPGGAFGGARPSVLAHDASTLGGSSGSAVVDTARNPATAVGLHFAAAAGRANFAHALDLITAHLESVLPPASWS